MLWAWLNRTIVEVSVLHDRNPVYIELTDGSLRNRFTVKILNKLHEERSFQLAAEGLSESQLTVLGFPQQNPNIDVVPDNLRALNVLITIPKAARAKLEGPATPFRFVVTDTADGSQIERKETFRGPSNE
jgi:polyferredoxin